MNPRVFVTQFTKRQNFTELNEYGEVTFLTDEEYRPEPTMPSFNDGIAARIKANFNTYIPGHDFIVTTGSAIPNIIVGSLLPKGEHNILKWNNMNRRFELFKVKV